MTDSQARAMTDQHDLNKVIERGAQAICDSRCYPGRYDQLNRGNAFAHQKWLEAAKAMLATLRPGNRIGENLWASNAPVELP